MKKIVLALFLFLTYNTFAQQQDTQAFTFPVIDSTVMYQQVMQVPGKSADMLYLKATTWYNNNFNYRTGKIVSYDAVDQQLVYAFVADVSNRTVNYLLRLNFKDGRYRYQLYNIRSTVKGKEDAVFFRKYLVDVPAELENRIVLGQEKGYSKSQKRQVQDDILLIDARLKMILKTLTDKMAYSPKDSDF